MGFADAYLLKAGLREPLIQTPPHSDLKIIVAIPANNESGLNASLDSLFKAATPVRTEVLILVNAAAGADPSVLDQNLSTLAQTEAWIAEHPHPFMDFHVRLDHTFGMKEAGVGMARKILMDEAARRFSAIANEQGIISCFDADARVDPNYFQALAEHFSLSTDGPGGEASSGREAGSKDVTGSERSSGQAGREGCSIYFEHPLEGDEFPAEVYEAITLYELHLRYYLAASRSTGYPYAFHTVGSSFAVRALVYCLEGGMNRRKAGEDFYFIQKLAQRGQWSECNTTRVIPSPRPSDRVPFGTGRAVKEFLQDMDILKASDSPSGIPLLKTYHPEPFKMLHQLFTEIDLLYKNPHAEVLNELPGVVVDFLSLQGFSGAMDEIRRNTGSPGAFRKRFWRWFNMFRIMKFLHYARESGFPDMEVGTAAQHFLSLEKQHTNRELLEIFRKSQRT